MMKIKNDPRLFLQLFAENAGGDSGVMASDAGMQGVKQEKAGAVAQTPEPNVPDRKAEFERLIKGEFKDQYKARVQDVVQKRLKSQNKTLEQYQALEPTLERLAKKYGVAPRDVEALNKAVAADEALAQEPGAAASRQPGVPEEQIRQKAQQQCDRWMQQAEQAKQLFPNLQLEQEVQNPRFLELLGRGLEVEEAYLLSHRHEIIPAAMDYSARTMEQKLTNWIVANGTRPQESGMSAQGTVMKNDVSSMTRAQRQEIIRRVQQGERIRL